MKKIILLAIIFFCFQNYALSGDIKCSTIGNKTTCSAKGLTLGTITTRSLTNGFVEVRSCTVFCESHIMTPLAAQDFIKQYKTAMYLMGSAAIQQEKQNKQIEANKKVIIKKVEITTNKGVKISLQEDKNNDDYYVVNGKRTKFSSYLATKTQKELLFMRSGWHPDSDISEQMGDNIDIEKLITENQKMDKLENQNRSIVQIIQDSRGLCELFKIVYKLRYDYGVSFKDAKKLMTFGLDNGNYKPQHLLLPREIALIKYETFIKLTEERFKDIIFPVIKTKG